MLSKDNKYNKFEAYINFEELLKLNKAFKICESIDDAYKIILNKFNEKKIFIQETIDFKVKILYFSLGCIITGEEQKIEIELKNDKETYLMKEFEEKYDNLTQRVSKLTKENENIKKELNNLNKEKTNMENKIKQFEEDMINMKKENNNLKKEIELLKSYCFKGQQNICSPTEYKKVDPLMSLKLIFFLI